MENLQKLKTLYKSGRFQCDLFFYTKLQQIVNHLNLYQSLPAILKNKHIVHNTAQLTKKHLIVLQQQDNEQKALQIIHQINRHVAQIDTKFVKGVFQEIDKMGGKSYEELIIGYVKTMPYKKMYSEIFDRLVKNVHDPKLRLEEMLTIGLFVAKNGDKVGNFIVIFCNVLENGTTQLKKFRQNYQFIQHNPQVQQHPKVEIYLKGSKVLVHCLLRLNQIYKLISGDGKFGLKLNALKKQIQAYTSKKQSHYNNNNNNNNINNHDNHSRPTKQFKNFLTTKQQLSNYCSLCLYQNQNQDQSINGDHEDCRNTIKLLYQPKQNKND